MALWIRRPFASATPGEEVIAFLGNRSTGNTSNAFCRSHGFFLLGQDHAITICEYSIIQYCPRRRVLSSSFLLSASNLCLCSGLHGQTGGTLRQEANGGRSWLQSGGVVHADVRLRGGSSSFCSEGDRRLSVRKKGASFGAAGGWWASLSTTYCTQRENGQFLSRLKS